MIRLMRNTLLSACCYMLLGLSSTAQSTEPFSLDLSGAPTWKAGSDIYVRVSMHNLSDKPIDCTKATSNNLDLRFRFVIKDESGNLLKKKVSKHPELDGAGSFQLCTLDPGLSTVPGASVISNLYNLTTPGKYEIQALRGVDDELPERYIKSNLITITVTP